MSNTRQDGPGGDEKRSLSEVVQVTSGAISAVGGVKAGVDLVKGWKQSPPPPPPPAPKE